MISCADAAVINSTQKTLPFICEQATSSIETTYQRLTADRIAVHTYPRFNESTLTRPLTCSSNCTTAWCGMGHAGCILILQSDW